MKTTTVSNEMKPSIRRTVEEMDGDIDKLQGDLERLLSARQTIVELYGGDTILPEPPLWPARDKTRASLPDRSLAGNGVQTPVRRRGGKRNGGGRRQAAPIGTALAAGSGAEPDGATVAAAGGREMSGDAVKLMATMRSCPEPFTMDSLRVATGFEAKWITNYLNRWLAKDWLVKVARGEFKRSGTFPPAA